MPDTSVPDEELFAIQAVIAAVANLKLDQQARVIGYLVARYPPVVSPAAIAVHPGDLRLSTPPADARTFIATKKPQTNVERVLVVATWLRTQGENEFTSERLREVALTAAMPKFDVVQAAKDAVRANLLTQAGEGRRQVTVLGEQIVEVLPDRERRKQLIAEQAARPTRRPRTPVRNSQPNKRTPAD